MKASETVVIILLIVALTAGGIASILILPWRTKGEADLSEVEEANSNLENLKVHFLGWVVHYSPDSVASYYKHHGKFTWVSPTWYVIDYNGNVVEVHYDGEFVNKSREWGVLILPLVANKGFDRETVHRVLTIPELRRRVIRQLVEIVTERGYDGINIDFENVPPEDREYLTLFMKELYEEFRIRGKIVSIDVPAKTGETYTGWSGAYDYAELSKYCDLFIVMAYDYHYARGRPGPISPLDWFEKVLDYTLIKVPKEKIVMGIPFYGYDWPLGGRGKGVTFHQAVELARKYGAKVRFDWESGEATFTYFKGGSRHDVWFNVAKSTELRIKMALRKGVSKIAAWRIGQEDPKTWSVISKP